MLWELRTGLFRIFCMTSKFQFFRAVEAMLPPSQPLMQSRGRYSTTYRLRFTYWRLLQRQRPIRVHGQRQVALARGRTGRPGAEGRCGLLDHHRGGRQRPQGGHLHPGGQIDDAAQEGGRALLSSLHRLRQQRLRELTPPAIY